MKNVKLLMALLASFTLLIGCSPTPPTDTDSSDTPDSTSTEIELIPVATWTLIDVNQAGKVTATEFTEYYTVNVPEEEKLSQEEAEQKFQSLDQDKNGELTKEEATGEQ